MKKKNSIPNLVLKFLFTQRGGNRLLVAYLDDVLGKDSWSKPAFYSAVSRFYKSHLVKKEGDDWTITQSGRNYFRNNRTRYTPNFIESPFKNNTKKNLLVIFDVPEDKKLYRDWLREQLKLFGYEMIQKSVWLGPSPLPKLFDKYLAEMGIKKCLQMFKINSK